MSIEDSINKINNQVQSRINKIDIGDISDVDKWVTRKVTGIFFIIFCAIIAISYILFFNTFILNKEKSILVNSLHFKLPMFIMGFLSSMIIIFIMIYNSKSDSFISILSVLVILNCLLILSLFGNSEYNPLNNIKNNKDAIMNCSKKMLGYGDSTGTCNNKYLFPLGQPLLSYISPFIIVLFIMFSIKYEKMFDKVCYGFGAGLLMLDYLFFKKYNALTAFFETNYGGIMLGVYLFSIILEFGFIYYYYF